MEILALNPSPRRKKRKSKGHKKEVPAMAKKRRKKSTRGRGRKFAIVRVNPGLEDFAMANPESRFRRVRRHATGLAAKSGLTASMHKLLPMVAGALAAKLAQKKFGDGTEETGNWTWKDYLTGALGVAAVSWASKGLFKGRPGTSQAIMDGGMLILAYKIITNEIVPMSETAQKWLGQDDGTGAQPDDEGSWAAGGFSVGDLYEDDSGVTYVLGADGLWRTADNSHRQLPDGTGLSGNLVRPSAQLGQDYEQPQAGFAGNLVRPSPQLGGAVSHGASMWGGRNFQA